MAANKQLSGSKVGSGRLNEANHFPQPFGQGGDPQVRDPGLEKSGNLFIVAFCNYFQFPGCGADFLTTELIFRNERSVWKTEENHFPPLVRQGGGPQVQDPGPESARKLIFVVFGCGSDLLAAKLILSIHIPHPRLQSRRPAGPVLKIPKRRIRFPLARGARDENSTHQANNGKHSESPEILEKVLVTNRRVL